MDWEQLAGQIVGSAAQVGLQFGAAYGQSWLQFENLERQYELAAKYRPAVPASNPLLLILLVGAVVLIARK